MHKVVNNPARRDKRGNRKGVVVGSNLKRLEDTQYILAFMDWQLDTYGDVILERMDKAKYFARQARFLASKHNHIRYG